MLAERDVRVSERGCSTCLRHEPCSLGACGWRDGQRDPERAPKTIAGGRRGEAAPSLVLSHQLRKAPILRFVLQMLEAGGERRVAMGPHLVKGEGAIGTRSFHSKPYAACSP